jgi:hypothetical protein
MKGFRTPSTKPGALRPAPPRGGAVSMAVLDMAAAAPPVAAPALAAAPASPPPPAPAATEAVAPDAAATDPIADLLKLAWEHDAAGRLEESEACVDRILATNPDHAEAIHLKGASAFRKGDAAEGARLMERSIEIGPVKPHFLSNLCEVYRILGRYDEALELGSRSAKLEPRNPTSHINLSVLHYARREPAEAIASAERALALNADLPAAHFGLAEPLLLRGDFKRGWDEYEWRFKLRGVGALMPKTDIPQWDGAPLPKGRLMLIADQGFGDCIQFCRYIPWAADRVGGEVVLACGMELQPLLGQLPGIDLMFDRWENCPTSDAYLPLSGLPRLHGTHLGNMPASVPYLRPAPDKAALWGARLDALISPRHRRVGLVWAGRPTHSNDRNRSISLDMLAPATNIDGVTFVSLQIGAATSQIGRYFGRAPLVNLGPEIGDFADSAAIIHHLDMTITVDTSVGHLSGALGKPAWIMLPYAPDWRWLMERTDSPWYPTVRLFRQPTHRAWDHVIGDIAGALADVEWPSRA